MVSVKLVFILLKHNCRITESSTEKPMAQSDSLHIGLMSGTSLDGIDAVLAKIGPEGEASAISAFSTPFAPELRKALFELQVPGNNELRVGKNRQETL
jgi:anhydro-N-acetylmuramic acid kinase